MSPISWEINIWLDTIFFALYGVVLFALFVVHLGGNFLTGRMKRRFKNWEWPHHDGPPIPFLPKYLHFQHVTCMIILALSGMYIRFVDRFPGHASWTRDFLQVLHYVAMVIVTINLFWRLWYALFSKRRDYKEFAITKADVVNLFNVVMYYAFIKPSKPHLDKYNIMQKAVYIAFAPMLAIQAWLGFGLLDEKYVPAVFGLTPAKILLSWNLGLMAGGDLPLAIAYARVGHYIFNWLFIIFTTIHVYLSVSEDFPAFLNFFGMSALDREHAPVDHGDGHGHDEGHDAGHGAGHDAGAPAIASSE